MQNKTKIVTIEVTEDDGKPTIQFTADGFTNFELLGLLRFYEQKVSMGILENTKMTSTTIKEII